MAQNRRDSQRPLLPRAARRRRADLWLDAAVVAVTLLALASLVAEYGFTRYHYATGVSFPISPTILEWARAGQLVGALLFALIAWAQFVATSGKVEYIKDHLVELALGLAVLAGLGTLLMDVPLSGGRELLLVKGLQVYLLLQLIAVFVRINARFARSILHPFRIIITSFLVLIVVGTLLLSLPAANYADRQRFAHWPNNLVDHLFTATSAVCVTGLVVRDTASTYTPFGQLVIATLIQLGGLGIVIFGSIFAMLVGRQVSLREASVLQDLYSEQALGQIRRIVAFIVISTLLIEAVGAIILFDMWTDPGLGTVERTFKSAFHAISAYCNAGFALQEDSLISYSGHWQVYLAVMPLIVLGGLGFPVMMNLAQVARDRLARRLALRKPGQDLDHFRIVSLSLQTRIVLTMSLALVVVGAVLIFVLETPTERQRWGRKVQYEDVAMRLDEAALRRHAWPQRALESLFMSVSGRTAGFNTVDTGMGPMRPSTLMVLAGLMFIGGSPASTAGGIKTVTFALLIAGIAATLRHRRSPEMFRRTIAESLLRRALVLTLLFFTLVWTLNLVLLITHPQINPLELLFEATSACATTGLSTGVTPRLNTIGQLAVIVGMFAGRLGPLTLLFALTGTRKIVRYEYPREGLVIG